MFAVIFDNWLSIICRCSLRFAGPAMSTDLETEKSYTINVSFPSFMANTANKKLPQLTCCKYDLNLMNASFLSVHHEVQRLEVTSPIWVVYLHNPRRTTGGTERLLRAMAGTKDAGTKDRGRGKIHIQLDPYSFKDQNQSKSCIVLRNPDFFTKIFHSVHSSQQWVG